MQLAQDHKRNQEKEGAEFLFAGDSFTTAIIFISCNKEHSPGLDLCCISLKNVGGRGSRIYFPLYFWIHYLNFRENICFLLLKMICHEQFYGGEIYILKCSTIICVQLSDFAELCSHHHNIILKHGNYSRKNASQSPFSSPDPSLTLLFQYVQICHF